MPNSSLTVAVHGSSQAKIRHRAPSSRRVVGPFASFREQRHEIGSFGIAVGMTDDVRDCLSIRAKVRGRGGVQLPSEGLS